MLVFPKEKSVRPYAGGLEEHRTVRFRVLVGIVFSSFSAWPSWKSTSPPLTIAYIHMRPRISVILERIENLVPGLYEKIVGQRWLTWEVLTRLLKRLLDTKIHEVLKLSSSTQHPLSARVSFAWVEVTWVARITLKRRASNCKLSQSKTHLCGQ